MITRAIRAAGLALLLSTGGCVMAVRHAAREINRESAEDRVRTALPIGTPKERIAAVMDGRGYTCAELPAGESNAFTVKCLVRVRERSAGTFLIGGNWSYEFTGTNGLLRKVHASGKRRRA